MPDSQKSRALWSEVWGKSVGHNKELKSLEKP